MPPKPLSHCKLLMNEYEAKIEARKTGSFSKIEDLFLEAMWEFDIRVVDGRATQGDRQNTKGDFFNNVVDILLAEGSGKGVRRRPRVPGLMIKRHNLDTAYPATGEVLFTVETKAMGTPKHGKSQAQKAEGRKGSADMDKRLKEAAFKQIDMSAEYERRSGTAGTARGDLTTWLKNTPPHAFIFFAARVVDAADRKKCEDLAISATDWFNGCGLFAYSVKDGGAPGYEASTVHTSIELDRVLHRACNELRSLD